MRWGYLMSKKKLVMIIVIIVLVLLGGEKIYRRLTRVQNVFDQMYYIRMEDAKYYWLGRRDISFRNMKQLRMQRGEDPNGAEMYWDVYREGYREEEHRIQLIFNKRTKYIVFFATWHFEEESELVRFTYRYDVTKKILEKGLIDIIEDAFGTTGKDSRELTEQEEIDEFLKRRNLIWDELEEFQEYFLYEKILVDWFEANSKGNKFSIDNLGEYVETMEE